MFLNQDQPNILKYMGTEELKIKDHITIETSNKEDQFYGFVMKENIKVTMEHGVKSKTSTVLSGELFFIPSHCRCTIENSGEQTSRVILIRFQYVGGELDSSCFQIYTFRLPQAFYWIQDFLNDGRNHDKALYYRLQSHIYSITSAFTAHTLKPKSKDGNLIDYVEQTKKYMQEHYNKPVDIEEIAQLSGSSSSRFYKAFKRYTGLSPNKFITTTRLNASLSLLANTSLPVMDVAHLVGYLDELYFSRLFKKHMGLTPTEYAACANKRIANLSPVFQGDLSVLGITPKISLHRGWSLHPEQYIKQIENCHPELILTSPVSEDIYERLQKIAPVVVLYWKHYSWRDCLLKISQALNLTSVAEHWLTYFDIKLENANQHISQQLGESFLVVGVLEGQFRVFGMQQQKKKDLFYDNLHVTSLDEIAALGSDHVVFMVQSSIPEGFCNQLEEDWKEGNHNRKCIFVRHTEALLYNAAVHESLIDEIVQLLHFSEQMRKSPYE